MYNRLRGENGGVVEVKKCKEAKLVRERERERCEV